MDSIREPHRALADVVRPLDEPGTSHAVGVDDVHLLVPEQRIETPEGDLAVHSAWPCARRKREHRGECDKERQQRRGECRRRYSPPTPEY
jgi:hypothetical protein